ncbi:MAG: hypothetical protein ACR2O4_08260 [Hyphomicrobiaceae bacterium]
MPRQFIHYRFLVNAFAMVLAALAISTPTRGVIAQDGNSQVNAVKIHVLRQRDCAACDQVHDFLRRVSAKDRWLDIRTLTMESSKDARSIYAKLLALFDVQTMDFPVTIIGAHVVTGYVNDRVTGMEILGHANFCRLFTCDDILEGIGEGGETILEVKKRIPALAQLKFAKTSDVRSPCATEIR